MPKVSIILLNYNSTNYTIQCIESIEEKTQIVPDYELIVVDNGSESEELSHLKKYIEGRDFVYQIQFIENIKNLGFSAGNQAGADRANAPYLFFLNNDCTLKNDVVSILYEFMEENRDAGLCSAKMLDENGNFMQSFTYLPSVWLKLLGSGFLRIFNKQRYLPRKVEYSAPQKVDVVAGAALFVRKEIFDNIGGFDLSYFLYCEEEDLAIRLKKNKSDIYFVPEAEYLHYQGKSSVKSYEILREFYISLFIFFRKHFNFFERFFFWLFYLQKFGLKPFRKHFFKLFLFVLKGASEKESLRYKQ
jgi:GT2 family glycosyltransferase